MTEMTRHHTAGRIEIMNDYIVVGVHTILWNYTNLKIHAHGDRIDVEFDCDGKHRLYTTKSVSDYRRSTA
mgnify:CR=1 FL=1